MFEFLYTSIVENEVKDCEWRGWGDGGGRADGGKKLLIKSLIFIL